MNIITLLVRSDLADSGKPHALYTQFGRLLIELDKAKLPQPMVESINADVTEVNAASLPPKELQKLVKKKQTKILKAVEKDLKIVPKNYYRTLWLALGMSAFGLPIGVAFGMSLGNLGLLGIGLPIGMAIGMVVGTQMDKKAQEEGRQLDIELKS